MGKLSNLTTIILTEAWTLLIGVGWYDTLYNPHTQAETISHVLTASFGTLAMFAFWGLVWVSLKDD